jgi:ADP-heptose:LPS heptosyltransferase
MDLLWILNKFNKKFERDELRKLILFNLWATLPEKELTIDQNIKFIEEILQKNYKILIFDKNSSTEKLLKLKDKYQSNKNIYFLKENLSLKEWYTLSKYVYEYYWPDWWLSHLISINCKSKIFFTKNNRVEKVWLPLQNAEAVII